MGISPSPTCKFEVTYPSGNTSSTVEILKHGVADETSKHAGERAAHVEPGYAARQLDPRVPAGHEEDGAREERRLREA